MNESVHGFCGSPWDGCLLVFAENHNKAKSNGLYSSFDWEYIYLSAHRKPDFDQFYRGESVIDSNDELPKGAPEFYSHEVF